MPRSSLLRACLLVVVPWGSAHACESSMANMVLQGQHVQAAGLFVSLDGQRSPADQGRIAEELRRMARAAQATGNPVPLTSQKTAGTSFRLEAGYKPPPGAPVRYTKAVFAVESPSVPGLLMNVLSVPDAKGCGVFAVQLETFDPKGIDVLKSRKP